MSRVNPSLFWLTKPRLYQERPLRHCDSSRISRRRRKKLLQVVLLGQPELDNRLAEPDLRQLRQRIGFSCQLRPLDVESMRVYINHRLRSAGMVMERLPQAELFTDRAIKQLCRSARGVPRLANIFAHKSLMLAYGKGPISLVRLW